MSGVNSILGSFPSVIHVFPHCFPTSGTWSLIRFSHGWRESGVGSVRGSDGCAFLPVTRVAQSRIGGDDQAPHDGGDGHVMMFAFPDQPVSEFLHLVIIDPGGVGRHIKDITRSPPPAGDVTDTDLLTTVTRHQGDTDQGCGRAIAEGAPLTHPADECRGRDRPDAGDGAQDRAGLGQMVIRCDHVRNGLIERVYLRRQGFDTAHVRRVNHRSRKFIPCRLERCADIDQPRPHHPQITQLLPDFVLGCDGSEVGHHPAPLGPDLRIHAIRLGQAIHRLGEVPRLTGIDHNHRKTLRTEGLPQRHMQPSCCFHHNAIGARFTPPCGDVGKPGRIIRHGPAFAIPINVQLILADINTG